MSKRIQSRNPEWVSDPVLGIHELVPTCLSLETENVDWMLLVFVFSLFKILINELNSFQGTRAHVSSEGFTSQPKASCWSQARPLKSRSAIAPRSFVFHLKMKPYLAIQEISTYTSVFSLGYRETAGRFLVGWLKGHFVPLLIFLCRWIRADGPIQQYSTSTVSADNIDWEQLPCLLCIDLMMGQAHMELAVLAFSP